MKDKFLASLPGVYILIFMVISPTLLTIFACILFNDFEGLYALIIPFIVTLILLLLRKYFFAEIELSEHGICKKYKNYIFSEISWNEIKSVESLPKSILVFKKIENEINDFNSMSFVLNSYSMKRIIKYKDYFKDKLKNLSHIYKGFEEQLLY